MAQDTGSKAGAEDVGGGRPEVLLEVVGLDLARDGRRVLCGAELSIRSGSVHVLLGPNGSGKSTLAYVIMGCPGYEPDAGVVRFAGADLAGQSMTERARLGITLGWQEPARFEGLTVRDYVGLSRTADDDAVARSLEGVSLDPAAYLDRPVDRTMSGGERKRIELAAVFAMHPRLAILDEPDSGIDVLTLDDVASLIRQMAQTGSAVLLITHRDEMLAVADAASLMCEGIVLHTGRPDEVRTRYAEHAHHGARPDARRPDRCTPLSLGGVTTR
jgi:Fe-S cluster assembly ATP-binding protein